jgi:hypothetical protein
VTAGTIMEKSRTPLKKWFLAMFLMGKDKRGGVPQENECAKSAPGVPENPLRDFWGGYSTRHARRLS